MTTFRVERITVAADVVAASALFDAAPKPDATRRFLADERHHLLLAYDGDEPVGMVTGVEMTHPDKGTEMFVYELGVAEPHRRRGIGTALVAALRDLAQDRGCYGMWVALDDDNDAALHTYRRAGADAGSAGRVLSWGWTTR